MDKKPNVLWVFADQLRAQAMGYRGDPNVVTPNIDNLARDGMRFDCAVAGAPWCCPFRGALLTGQYPHRNGVIQTPGALDQGIPTVVEPFRAAGYHTAYVGKWHLHGSNNPVYIPPDARCGFDYWMGYENRNAQYDTTVFGSDDENGFRLDGYETDALTDILLNHIEGHVAKPAGEGDYQPFFGVLSVQPPHNPYIGPAGFHRGRNPASIQLRPNVPQVDWVRERAALDLAGYYAMIENLDWNIGRIRDKLRRLDVDRETWIIFFSDHGDCLGSHAQWHKSSPWEESIRIPFIIGRAGGDRRCSVGINDAVLNHVDIAPTTLGLCGLEAPATMVGFDYSANCHLGGKPDRAAEPTSAFLQQIPAKRHAHSVNRPWRAVVTRDRWKYACMPGHDWLLFNLNEDCYEQANYAFDEVYGRQLTEMQSLLRQWIDDTGDAFQCPTVE